jgi:hypothetical protein
LDYPHYEKMVRMLRYLSQAEKEAREQYPENTHLYLGFYHRDQPARLQIQETQQNVADELQMSGAEAISLLEELSADDYIDLVYDRDGPNAGAGIVKVIFRQKGRTAILEVPDPNAELVRRLEALATAIEHLEGVDPVEKKRAADMVRGELTNFGRNLAPQAAVTFVKGMAAYYGIGWE